MQSIKKNSRFREIYAKGESKANKTLVLYKYPNDLPYSRLGVTVSGKVGKAHVRNKIKRRIKEIIRLSEERIYSGYDLIFVSRIKAAECDYALLNSSVEHLLSLSGLYVGKEKPSDE